MPEQNKSKRTHYQPLAPDHQRTARLLFLALDVKRGEMKLVVPAADLRFIRRHLTQLIDLSDTRRAGDNHAQAFTRALQALRVKIDAGWISHNKVYGHAEAIADRLAPHDPEAENSSTAGPGKTFISRVADRLNYPGFDLRGGDALSVEETRDVRPGEIVWCKFDEDGRVFAGLARLVSMDAEEFTVRTHEGEMRTHDFAEVQKFGRVVSYTRRVQLIRPDPIPEHVPQDSPASIVHLSTWRRQRANHL